MGGIDWQFIETSGRITKILETRSEYISTVRDASEIDRIMKTIEDRNYCILIK